MSDAEDLAEIRAQGARAEASKVEDARIFVACFIGTVAWIASGIFFAVVSDSMKANPPMLVLFAFPALVGIFVGVFVNGAIRKGIEAKKSRQ